MYAKLHYNLNGTNFNLLDLSKFIEVYLLESTQIFGDVLNVFVFVKVLIFDPNSSNILIEKLGPPEFDLVSCIEV